MLIEALIILGSSLSIAFGAHQWWGKRKLMKLEEKKIKVEEGAAQAVEAANMMEMVNIFLKSLNLMRDAITTEIKDVLVQFDAHALQDQMFATEIRGELHRISENIQAATKGSKGDTGDQGIQGVQGVQGTQGNKPT